MKKIIYSIVVIAVLSQSCATIFTGTKSGVHVKGDPDGASVYYNGSHEGEAPCRIKVSKNSLKDGNTKVQIKKDGFENSEIVLSRKLKFGAFLADFFVFPAGHIVDFVTGAIYKPYPKRIDYKLKSKSNVSLQSKLKIGDKVIFSNDDYQNIKGEIIAVFPNRATIKFKVENNALKKKMTKEDYTVKQEEIALINIAKAGN